MKIILKFSFNSYTSQFFFNYVFPVRGDLAYMRKVGCCGLKKLQLNLFQSAFFMKDRFYDLDPIPSLSYLSSSLNNRKQNMNIISLD